MSPRTSTSSAGRSITRLIVDVVGATPATGKVMCRDTGGSEFEVDGSYRVKGSGFPAVGERWVLLKTGNVWVLEIQIGARSDFPITGDRVGLDPVVGQMLDAMIAHGLVQDFTDALPAEPPLDDTTDAPVPDPTDDELNLDNGDEGVPITTEVNENTPEPTDKNDNEIPSSQAASDLFTAISFNLLCDMGPARARQDLKRLYPQADLIGLQECARVERGLVLEERDDDIWGMHRPLSDGGKWSPILWNKNVLQRRDGDTVSLSPWDGPGTGRPERSANWVYFTHRATGVSFTVINFHWENSAAFPGRFTPTRVASAPRHIERYHQQMAGIIDLVQERSKHGSVMLMGDFNVHAKVDVRERNPGLPTASLGQIDMRSNWEVLGLPPVGTLVGPSGAVFDWMFLKNRIVNQMAFSEVKVLTGYNSNHRPVSAKIRVKNFAK